MKKTLFLAVLAFAAVFSAQAQTTNTLWTFETSAPITAGPVSPEIGTGSATGFHAGAVTYSSPAGNGSAKSYSANTWAVGDYWQFQVSTVGFSNIGISYDQVSSSTGPGSFDLAYSTDGINFTTFSAAYTVLVNASPNAWSAGTHINSTTFFDDFSSVLSLNNASSVYFRIIDHSTLSAGGATVAAGGTDRIDNFTVLSNVPEPSTLAMTGIGLAGFIFLRRRKN